MVWTNLRIIQDVRGKRISMQYLYSVVVYKRKVTTRNTSLGACTSVLCASVPDTQEFLELNPE